MSKVWGWKDRNIDASMVSETVNESNSNQYDDILDKITIDFKHSTTSNMTGKHETAPVHCYWHKDISKI